MSAEMIKTTIELDEAKLERVMKLGGFSTRKEAIDWALTEAERIASLNRIAQTPWSSAMMKEAVDENYDVLAARQQVRYTAPKRRKK